MIVSLLGWNLFGFDAFLEIVKHFAHTGRNRNKFAAVLIPAVSCCLAAYDAHIGDYLREVPVELDIGYKMIADGEY